MLFILCVVNNVLLRFAGCENFIVLKVPRCVCRRHPYQIENTMENSTHRYRMCSTLDALCWLRQSESLDLSRGVLHDQYFNRYSRVVDQTAVWVRSRIVVHRHLARFTLSFGYKLLFCSGLCIEFHPNCGYHATFR